MAWLLPGASSHNEIVSWTTKGDGLIIKFIGTLQSLPSQVAKKVYVPATDVFVN